MTEPPDIYERAARDSPVILAFWHGQHFLTPFIKRAGEHRAKVLISRHRDGELNAQIAERLGVEAIRGSGNLGSEFVGKGGVSAFREMLAALAEGYNVALTADVPKVARVAGLGIVKLASASGRPIYPLAIATRRRIELKTWDRTTINLPFTRGAAVIGDPIRAGQWERRGAGKRALCAAGLARHGYRARLCHPGSALERLRQKHLLEG